MTVIRRRPKAPGQNGKQILEQDGVSPEGEARRLWVIHPFLIALIPILHLLAANPGQARFSDALTPMLISLGFALVAFVILGLVLKNWEASGLIVSLFLVMFFSTGHLVNFVITRSLVSLLSLLFAALFVILAAGAFIVVKSRDRLRNPTRIVNVVAAVLIALVLVQLLTSGTHKNVAIRTDEVGRAAASKDVALPDPAHLPDIYYIILDSYGSERFLREHYGYDNSQFIRSLENRGFYVVHDSHSNYNHTDLSLASSLNMTYINYVSEEVGKRSRSLEPLDRMVEDNSLMRFLKSRGYKFAFYGTGYSATRSNRYADIAHVENWYRSDFMATLINSTLLRCFRPAFATRESVLDTFADIPLTRKRVKGPLFLFAHILPPHPPYLFDRNGKSPKSSDDAKAMYPPGTTYLEQLMYVNKKVKEMVDEILSVSDRQPVIVLQGDHGPFPDWNNPTTENLNALLIPNGKNLFYPSITPVNSFKIILNSIFGTDFSLLQDRTYTSPTEAPYAFKEITKTLDGEQ